MEAAAVMQVSDASSLDSGRVGGGGWVECWEEKQQDLEMGCGRR